MFIPIDLCSSQILSDRLLFVVGSAYWRDPLVVNTLNISNYVCLAVGELIHVDLPPFPAQERWQRSWWVLRNAVKCWFWDMPWLLYTSAPSSNCGCLSKTYTRSSQSQAQQEWRRGPCKPLLLTIELLVLDGCWWGGGVTLLWNMEASKLLTPKWMASISVHIQTVLTKFRYY